jgi:hypothetical protein
MHQNECSKPEEAATIGQPEKIRLVTSPPFRADDLTAVIQSILETHGGRLEISIDVFTLHFPEGTILQELYPRVNFPRFRITFPDGYEILRTVDRNGNTFDIGFPDEDVPEDIRRRYKRW